MRHRLEQIVNRSGSSREQIVNKKNYKSLKTLNKKMKKMRFRG